MNQEKEDAKYWVVKNRQMIWKFNLQLCNGTKIVYKDRCRYMRRKFSISSRTFKSFNIKEMKIPEKRTKLKPVTSPSKNYNKI
jgi:hypothetical protein